MGTAWERVVKGRLASHALSRLWSGCKRPDLCLWVVKRSFLGFDQANSRTPKTTTLVPLSWHQLWPKKLGLWNPGDIHPLLEKTLSQHLPRCLYFGSTWASPILDNRSDLMKLTEDWQPGVVPVRISPSSLWPSSYSTITTPSCPALQPSRCGCEDLSVRLGSRISLNRHWVVVEVHWRGAQGWRSGISTVCSLPPISAHHYPSWARRSNLGQDPRSDLRRGDPCCHASQSGRCGDKVLATPAAALVYLYWVWRGLRPHLGPSSAYTPSAGPWWVVSPGVLLKACSRTSSVQPLGRWWDPHSVSGSSRSLRQAGDLSLLPSRCLGLPSWQRQACSASCHPQSHILGILPSWCLHLLPGTPHLPGQASLRTHQHHHAFFLSDIGWWSDSWPR